MINHVKSAAGLEVIALDRAKHTTERKSKVTFQFEKRNPSMNRDRGIEESGTWNAIVWRETETEKQRNEKGWARTPIHLLL